jgi:2-C-methyl-D-erythritol 4-phosphate cytidylyltransferase
MVTALVPAAGTGTRMGGGVHKQWLQLDGKPMLSHALTALCQCSQIDEIIVIAHGDDLDLCRETYIGQDGFAKVTDVIPGGENRQMSVFNGLRYLSWRDEPPQWVLIHDGVRPLVTVSLIEQVIRAGMKYGAALSAIPAVDTLKRVDPLSLKVIETVDRSTMWQAQTPQMFRFAALWAVHQRAFSDGWNATDDAALLEMAGEPVTVIRGDPGNLKVTHPQDLVMAEIWTRIRKEPT